LAERANGLSATAIVTFTAPGRPSLHERITVSFVRKAPARAHPPTQKKKSR
jgi:hypothetical protein